MNRHLLRTILQIACLLWLPAVLGMRYAEDLAASAVADAAARQKAEIRAVLRRVADQADPFTLFTRLFQRWTRAPVTPRKLVRRLRSLAETWPGACTWYLFDAHGKALQLPGQPAFSKRAAEGFLAAIRDEQAPILRSLLVSFGGHPGTPRLIAGAPNRLVDLRNGMRQTWGGWWPLRGASGKPLGHLLVFVHRSGLPADKVLRRSVDAASRLVGDQFLIGWTDPGSSTIHLPASSEVPEALRRALEAAPFGVSELTSEDGLIVRHGTAGGRTLFCAGRQAPDAWLAAVQPSDRWNLHRVLLLGALVPTILLLGLEAGPLGLRLGLQPKLILQLILAGGFPLAILLITAAVDRGDREQALMKRVITEHQEALTRIDGEFPVELEGLRAEYLRRLAMSLPATSSPLPLQGLVQESNGLIIRLLAVDHTGAILFSERAGEESSAVLDFNRQLAANVLRHLRVDPGGTLISATPSVPEMISLHLARGINEGKTFINQKIANQEATLVFLPFRPGPNGPDALLLAAHSCRQAQIRTLRNRFDRGKPANDAGRHTPRQVRGQEAPVSPQATAPSSRQSSRPISRTISPNRIASYEPGRSHLLAVPVEPGPLWPAFPRFAGDEPHLRDLCDRVISSRLPQSLLMPIGRTEYLVTGLLGRSLDGYVLLMATPGTVLQEEIRRFDHRLLGLVIAIFAGIFLLARSTSRSLLEPLERLGEALRALQAGSVSWRLGPETLAELQRMADRLNLIVEDRRDLQNAAIVREHLWPSARHEPGWSIESGLQRHATEDHTHHDWLPLADGRLLILGGELQATGIAAGLLSAGLKMELALAADSPDPVLLYERLFGHRDAVRPRQCWIAVFAPLTGELRFTAFGEPHLTLVRPGSPGKRLETAGSGQETILTLIEGSELSLHPSGAPTDLPSTPPVIRLRFGPPSVFSREAPCR